MPDSVKPQAAALALALGLGAAARAAVVLDRGRQSSDPAPHSPRAGGSVPGSRAESGASQRLRTDYAGDAASASIRAETASSTASSASSASIAAMRIELKA